MTAGHSFTLGQTAVVATAARALWLPATQTLCVSDLHLGKAGRIARRGGTMLPPYETLDTLHRLATVIGDLAPKMVICLGDSFDDLDAADELLPDALTTITQVQSGRFWYWIEGNHDAGPIRIGGTHVQSLTHAGLHFRHIATEASSEVSGHYHPKHGINGTGPARPCFVYDANRLIMPAFGTYTGGVKATSPEISGLFGPKAIAVLTGPSAVAVPLKRSPPPRGSRGKFY